MLRVLQRGALVVSLVVATTACPGTDDLDGAPGDGSADGKEADAEGSADGPSTSTDGGATEGGPITQVVTGLTMSAEYVCDLDGDGQPDNAIADLLNPSAGLFSMSLTSTVQGGIDDGRLRLIFHFPWVDDVANVTDENATALIFDGKDDDSTDLDPDPGPEPTADDFTGSEPYSVFWRYLDPCGEPLSYVPDVRLDGGEVYGQHGVVPIVLGDRAANADIFLAQEAVLSGTISPGGGSAELTICGYTTIGEVGRVRGPLEGGDLTLLEVLLAGGRVFGLSLVPGLDADIDVDGDGLETFSLDDEGRLLSCVDGDRTVIEGRDCWMDERMADGFAITFDVSTVSAVFQGRQPGWEELVEGTCEEPPETSLFDAV